MLPSYKTLNVVPVNDNALPAVYEPACENCVQIYCVVPTTIGSPGLVGVFVLDQPVNLLAEPSVINV